jgi:FixJ family two-component response regulator
MNLQEAHVFVVDDDPAILTAFQRALEDAGMQVRVFSSAEDSLTALPQHACDVIITGIRLQNRDGLSLLQEVRRRFPWLRIVIVTACADIPLAVAAIKAGAADFLEKPVSQQELVSAVKNAIKDTIRSAPFPREALSPAEVEVLRLFLEGRSSRDIGTTLNRSTRTIEVHRQCLMRKFGVHNAVQLAQKASELWLDE